MVQDKLQLIGYASGEAGVDLSVNEGPRVIQQSTLFNNPENYHWSSIIHSPHDKSLSLLDKVSHACKELAKCTADLTKKQKPFCVIGGDHASAIGTWSGVYHAMHHKGDLGLIWIDAHMDSHTAETTLTGRIHGMPLACLLGYGYSSLTHILQDTPKIKPENVCLIGVRSFESGEAELLAQLNVRVYFMEEVTQHGILTVLQEAVKKVSANTAGFGISLDLDAIDPLQAPGVQVPESDGLNAAELSAALIEIVNDPALIGTEIVEFDPSRDVNRMTEKLIVSLLEIIHGKKS